MQTRNWKRSVKHRGSKGKAVRKTRLTPWRDKYFPKLKKIHKNHAENIFHRMMKKTSTLRSSLKRRSKEYEVEFNVSLTEIRQQMYDFYGRPCRYCGVKMDVRNMVCDHIIPMSMGGESVISNLQLICDRCNTRKGPLTHEMYADFVEWIEKHPIQMQEYIYRKLAKSDVFS